MKQFFIVFIGSILTLPLAAQVPTIQDCLGAIPVCQQIYSESLSPSGDGNYNNEINTSISCTAGELNSIWYTFTVNQSGDFGFVITPSDPNDDYDWVLFDITNADCDDIFTDPSLTVSCNAAGGFGCHGPTGATGTSNWDIQGAGCNSSPPSQAFGFSPFNDFVQVVEGNTYVLMVSNWTGSNNGYEIDFGLGGNIGIIDVAPPEIVDLQTPTECNQNEITLTFSEFVQCNTLDALNFTLTGPGGPYTISEVFSANCDQGGTFDKEFTLTIDPPIASLGDFDLELVVNGSTEALDLCDNPADPIVLSFTVTDPIPITVNIGNDTSILCVGQTLTLDATAPSGTYIWQDGSMDATYQVTNTGIYFVDVEDACGFGSDTIQVIYLMVPPVVDLGPDTDLCEGDPFTLDATNDFSTYLWQDGTTTATYSVSNQGVYSVDVTNACGTTSDTVFVNLIPNLNLDLGPDLVFCSGDTVSLDAGNEDATYLWQDGNINPIYQVTTSGTYSVEVSTICEVDSDEIIVTFLEEDPFSLGPDTVICYDDTLLLGYDLAGAVYNWQDGSTGPLFSVSETGTYAVTVTTNCEVFEDEKVVTVLPPIEYDLGNDTFLCASQIYLEINTPGFANFLWQDGSKLPYFIIEEPGAYSVSVFNQCEEVVDIIEVKECEVCDVYFPNIFSPDFDGFNDDFMAFSDCPLEDFTFKVFDRWGSLLFETNDPKEGWNGTNNGQRVTIGTYVWWMEFTVIENGRPRTEIASGDVVVIR